MFLNEAREGIYGASFKETSKHSLNSVTLPKKAGEKRNIFHMLRCNPDCRLITDPLPRKNGVAVCRRQPDSRQEGFDASVSGNFFGLGEDAEHAGRRGQAIHIASGGLQRARDFEANWGFAVRSHGPGIRLNDKGRLLEERLARCITSSRMCSRWWRVTNWRARFASAHPLRCPTSCCRKCCTISRCGTIRSKSNVSRGIRRISCAMWNTACLDVGFVEGDVHNLAVEITPSPRNPS